LNNSESLYRELKPDVERLANALFGASEVFVRKRGAFLPHGALLSTDGKVQLIMTGPDSPKDNVVSPIEVLPTLHQALRLEAVDEDALALAVCEDVRITGDNQRETRAIKVLIEHRRGLCTALYLPFRRKMFGYSFGDVFAMPAEPEVNAWLL